MSKCECDHLCRRWNPLTGCCESCGSRYVDDRPAAPEQPTGVASMYGQVPAEESDAEFLDAVAPEQPTPATQAAEIARLRAAINVASRLIGETIERSREESSQAWFLARLAKIKYALAPAPTQHEPRADGGEHRAKA